ncbi:MAG: MFS transporter [Planctomycetes bacterium]|nr:MFS transporter [Planctomycetota bacterium]
MPTPQPDNLAPLSRYTQQRFILVEILHMLSIAVLGFSAFIISKKFNGSNNQIIILTNGPHILFLLSYFASVLMAGKSKKPFLLVAGIVSQLCLVFSFFVDSSLSFTILLCFIFLGPPFYGPAMNAILQRNVRPQHRGRVMGTVNLWGTLMLTLCTLIIGNLLHADDDNFYWLFPCAGIIGFCAYYFAGTTRIRLDMHNNNTKRLRSSLSILKNILHNNRSFLHFEIAFFIYGVGFMICLPTNMIVLTNILEISYQEFAIGISVCCSLFLALFSPLGGKIFDRLGPTRSCAFTFLAIASHVVLMLCALHTGSEFYAYAAYAAFGMGIAGVSASWVNGPVYFAGKEDSAVYMGIHMSNVGLRACVGTTCILLLSKHLHAGDHSTIQILYYTSIGLIITASVYMSLLKAPASKKLK